MTLGQITKTLPIGIDLGNSSIKMAQLKPEQESLDLVAAAAFDVPPHCRVDQNSHLQFAEQAIRDALRTTPFQGRKCIVCLPDPQTFLQHIRVPRLDAWAMTKAVRNELTGKLPYSVDDAVIQHIVAGNVFGDPDNKQEVIVVAANRGALESYLTMVAKCKLEVVGINIGSCAIVECFSRLFRVGDANNVVLYIDLGASSTHVVVAHSHKLVFARNLAQGEVQVDQAVASGMGITADQAHALRWDLCRAGRGDAAEDEFYRYIDVPLMNLAHEINQCLHYYESAFRNQPAERIVFVGGGAYDKRLCQTLARQLNLPAQIGDPLVRVRRPEGVRLPMGLERREPQPNWAVAVGLSLGAGLAA